MDIIVDLRQATNIDGIQPRGLKPADDISWTAYVSYQEIRKLQTSKMIEQVKPIRAIKISLKGEPFICINPHPREGKKKKGRLQK